MASHSLVEPLSSLGVFTGPSLTIILRTCSNKKSTIKYHNDIIVTPS